MLVREDSIPMANTHSSTILFDQTDSRNKKRMVQMLRRKTALSAKHNDNNDAEKNLSLIKSPITIDNDKNDDLLVNNEKNIFNNNLDIEKENIFPKILEMDNIAEIKKNFNCESNMINLDCSPILSNTMFNENNNYYNNSSTNNSNNNSIINRDSQEKEINISNLENDSIDDIIINKEDNTPEEECLINNEKVLSKNLYNYDRDDEANVQIKEERKIKEENEFALKYLTSTSDSFVQLDNHLVARAKAQGNEMTDSYLQALFPDLILDSNKPLKNKNYEVTEIIKEEKEIDFDSPFGKTFNFSKYNKTTRGSINSKLNLKHNNSLNKINKPNKLLKKTKSNTQLLNKRNIIAKMENKNKSKNCIKNKPLLDKKIKSSSNFKNTKKIIKKNNNISEKIKSYKHNKKLNISCSLSNISINKIKNNNLNLKLKSDSELYSTFSSNLYSRSKTELKLKRNINIKHAIKNSTNNLLDDFYELNDTSLINNCVKNINKPKKAKINNHYLKNINYYNKYKEASTKNKSIKKRNQTDNFINELDLDSTFVSNTSNINYLKSTYITRKPKNSLIKINPKKNISTKLNTLNINSINNINSNNHKRINHKNCVSSFSLNESKKLKRILTENSTMKSFSKLMVKKYDDLHISFNSESNSRKTKSNHKKLNTISNSESTNIETSFIKTKNRPSNNNRFISFHKKIDYSYVKAKVETGLSEEVLKKLLNNNKNLQKKEAMKKSDIEKKQSLLKKCKTSMNKTIESFKTMASKIKRRFFKNDKNT